MHARTSLVVSIEIAKFKLRQYQWRAISPYLTLTNLKINRYTVCVSLCFPSCTVTVASASVTWPTVVHNSWVKYHCCTEAPHRKPNEGRLPPGGLHGESPTAILGNDLHPLHIAQWAGCPHSWNLNFLDLRFFSRDVHVCTVFRQAKPNCKSNNCEGQPPNCISLVYTHLQFIINRYLKIHPTIFTIVDTQCP